MIVIRQELVARVAAHAVHTYPAECCGLLLGVRGAGDVVHVIDVAESRNFASQRDRFEIDPQLWLDVTRSLGQGTREIIGHYHSHPDGAAAPSALDLTSAWDETQNWLIVAVADGVVDDVKAYRLAAGQRQFKAIPLRIVAGDEDPNRFKVIQETT
jgi:proteasome lid subunit RPN8/RPN11